MNETGDRETGDGEAARQAEVRHTLANIFQFLATLTRLRLGRTRDAESRRHLDWMQDMTAALGVLQSRLHSAGGDDFSLFLEDMAQHWRRRCDGRPIRIDLAVEPLAVAENHASTLALIVNELVGNAITHGFPDGRPGRIVVGLSRAGDGRAVLTVEDDGAGYDPDAAPTDRMGLWLVGALASQVRGETSVSFDQGVRRRLEFPLAPS